LPGERNPQSAAKEFAPPPQGESVFDASMMAELIVTKKEIAAQLKESTGTSQARPKSPGAGSQRLPLAGRHGAEHWIVWFLGLGALLAAEFAASVRTLVEGKIGADTAAWTPENQGHPHDRQKPERCQRSGRAGLDRALVAAEDGSRLPSCDAAPRGGCSDCVRTSDFRNVLCLPIRFRTICCIKSEFSRSHCRPDGRGVAGYPRRVGKRETTAVSLARRGERLLPALVICSCF
jgi:hypothetical protein